jgi:hypothetical protein
VHCRCGYDDVQHVKAKQSMALNLYMDMGNLRLQLENMA